MIIIASGKYMDWSDLRGNLVTAPFSKQACSIKTMKCKETKNEMDEVSSEENMNNSVKSSEIQVHVKIEQINDYLFSCTTKSNNKKCEVTEMGMTENEMEWDEKHS